MEDYVSRQEAKKIMLEDSALIKKEVLKLTLFDPTQAKEFLACMEDHEIISFLQAIKHPMADQRKLCYFPIVIINEEKDSYVLDLVLITYDDTPLDSGFVLFYVAGFLDIAYDMSFFNRATGINIKELGDNLEEQIKCFEEVFQISFDYKICWQPGSSPDKFYALATEQGMNYMIKKNCKWDTLKL